MINLSAKVQPIHGIYEVRVLGNRGEASAADGRLGVAWLGFCALLSMHVVGMKAGNREITCRASPSSPGKRLRVVAASRGLLISQRWKPTSFGRDPARRRHQRPSPWPGNEASGPRLVLRSLARGYSIYAGLFFERSFDPSPISPELRAFLSANFG